MDLLDLTSSLLPRRSTCWHADSRDCEDGQEALVIESALCAEKRNANNSFVFQCSFCKHTDWSVCTVCLSLFAEGTCGVLMKSGHVVCVCVSFCKRNTES